MSTDTQTTTKTDSPKGWGVKTLPSLIREVNKRIDDLVAFTLEYDESLIVTDSELSIILRGRDWVRDYNIRQGVFNVRVSALEGIQHAESLMDSLATHGSLQGEYVEILRDLLYLPPMFPRFDIALHDSREDWIKLCVFIERDRLKLFDAKELLAEMAQDLLELLVDGDKSSEDELLRLLDGLKKLAEWPECFFLSNRIDVVARDAESVASHEIYLYFAVGDQAD